MPPEAMMHFPLFQIIAPYFRKPFRTPWKIFSSLPFSKKIDFRPLKFLTTFFLFLVIYHKFSIFPPIFAFRCFNTFPPVSRNMSFPPTFPNFPSDFGKFTYFYMLYVFSVSPYFECTYCVFIFVLLGKNIGRQTATRIHDQKAYAIHTS